jgi:hypothetical protein
MIRPRPDTIADKKGMASRRATPLAITDDDLVALLQLIRDADSVELKLTVPETKQRSVVTTLGMDPLDAEIRQVFFFDTPNLTLYEHGVVARARRMQGKGGDSTVKLRPVDPAALPAEVRHAKSFGVEVDAMPGAYTCSGSMKNKLGSDSVRDAIEGKQPLRKLFSKEQRALFADHAPDGIALDDLAVLGPIFVLKLKFSPQGYERKLVAEMWLYPDYSAVLELSTKCPPGEAFQAAAETRAFLGERGVSLSGEQRTKTRKALEFFSERQAGRE